MYRHFTLVRGYFPQKIDLPNISAMNRMQHKVNLQLKWNSFEPRAFLFLDWLPNQGKKAQSIFIQPLYHEQNASQRKFLSGVKLVLNSD